MRDKRRRLVRSAAREILGDLDVPAPVSVVAPSGAPEAAGVDRGATAQMLEDRPIDPETLQVLEEIARQQATGVDNDTYNQQVAVYNSAVEMANRGASPDAIAILEELLPQLRSEELLDQTRSLLERMKNDLARLTGR